MKIKFVLPVVAIALFGLLQLISPAKILAASDLSDGTYKIDYLITKAENDSASMANDYFEKPAVLQVKNGAVTAEIQMNHSKWITIFKTAIGSDFTSAEVAKSDKTEDTRVARFQIEDLNKPLLAKIHVTVPDIDYDHDYTIRFLFDLKSLKSTGGVQGAGKAQEAGGSTAAAGSTSTSPLAKPSSGITQTTVNTGQQKPVVNPQTGDDAPIAMFAGLFLLSGVTIIYLIRGKRRLKKPIKTMVSASVLMVSLLASGQNPAVYALEPDTGGSKAPHVSAVSTNPQGIADGTYSVAYEFHKFNTEQVSVMQDYVINPGKLLVKNGKMLMQITLKQSKEITSIKLGTTGNLSSPEIIAMDELKNTRTVQFEVPDLKAKVQGWVKIYWQVSATFLYDHEYDVDLIMDPSTLKAIPGEPQPAPVQDEKVVSGLKDMTNHWAKAAVEQAVNLKIVNGYEDGTFHPDGEINRAEFAVLLNRALKLKAASKPLSFTDSQNIPEWAKSDLSSATESGLLGGYEDGTFRADRTITRAELAVIVVRALQLKTDVNAKPLFTDAANIPQWAQAEVAAASESGIISGRDQNKFAPEASATRAEAVSLVMKLIQKKSKE
ncbi:heme uptake protein IsdC [Paenibacillus ferrarius]|uniref:Heme uptake protein IsdC n=1 Tax=Paenibacillus ferrarius TaxID=1469647 RepID=A0A1V4HMA2_9BACL|nr:heme uptake protein IsdC [Paenibacillus ferrarius]OPH58150.1 heme uptake protein IsdC [Paenibacillus ferrarius]